MTTVDNDINGVSRRILLDFVIFGCFAEAFILTRLPAGMYYGGSDALVVAKNASWKDANGDDDENEHKQFANYGIVFEGKKRLGLADQTAARGHAQQIADSPEHDDHVGVD